MRRLGSAALVLALVAGIGGAAALSSTGSTCAQRQAAESAYAHGIAKARAAYFAKHRSPSARKAFVAAQKAKLAALKSAAACSATTTTTDLGTVPAPAPTANERFVFSDELSQAFRDDIQGFVTFAVQDEEKLLGVSLDQLTVYVSTDAGWLAQQQCSVLPQDGDCVSSVRASFAGGNPTAEGPHVIFVNCATTDLTTRAPEYERQKIVGHSVGNVFRYQLDGRRDDVGPLWLLFGAPELLGYHVASDRNLRAYADSLADMRQNMRVLATPLEKLQTWADYNLVGHWYLAGAVDRLVTDAPNGIRSLADYWAGIGTGMSWEDAFAAAFGMTVDQFYADFAAYKAGL
ncbi:MAG TPA: hypothetical protein VHD91_02085 [Gaiellaceae bacterium]|nr:hypothetical protein [Gaiellaceae bacterium]